MHRLDNPMIFDEIVNHFPDAVDECDMCGEELDDEKYDDGSDLLCKHCLLDKYLIV